LIAGVSWFPILAQERRRKDGAPVTRKKVADAAHGFKHQWRQVRLGGTVKRANRIAALLGLAVLLAGSALCKSSENATSAMAPQSPNPAPAICPTPGSPGTSGFNEWLKLLAVLAGVTGVLAFSASRHVALSDRLRKLTEEFRNPRSVPLCEERQESIREQVKIFRWRCKTSSWAHILLCVALGLEIAVLMCALWPQTGYRFLLLPLFLIFVGALLHVIEHCRAFATINLETEDVLKRIPPTSTS